MTVETKVHQLDDEVTPSHKMFVRNNGIVPLLPIKRAFQSGLKIDGALNKEASFSLADLKSKFKPYEYQLY